MGWLGHRRCIRKGGRGREWRVGRGEGMEIWYRGGNTMYERRKKCYCTISGAYFLGMGSILPMDGVTGCRLDGIKRN
jgi:hypothetical protein